VRSLLIVDPDAGLTRSLARDFARIQPELTVLTASNAAEALERLGERTIDLVLANLGAAEANGFELVNWTTSHCPDTSFFVMAQPGRSESPAALAALGIIGCFEQPVDTRAALLSFGDAINQSVHGHIQNVSLASFLQLLEMERKTCQLTVACGEKRGELTVRNGRLVHARCDGAEGDAAAISAVAWPNPGITVSRSFDVSPATIQQTLGFIVMEAMRVQDEAGRAGLRDGDGQSSNWPPDLRTWRPSGTPQRGSQPPPSDFAPRMNGDFALSSGAHLLAVVDMRTGAVLQYAAANGSPVSELARNAFQLLQQEMTTLRLCDAEGLEELVLSTTTRCDVIRPLGANEFALLVFAPEETNLMMARLELEQFIASADYTQRTP